MSVCVERTWRCLSAWRVRGGVCVCVTDDVDVSVCDGPGRGCVCLRGEDVRCVCLRGEDVDVSVCVETDVRCVCLREEAMEVSLCVNEDVEVSVCVKRPWRCLST